VAGGNRKNADATLLAALASGATVEAAAKQAGVSEGTVYRRLREPGFKAEIDQARADLIERAVSVLAGISSAAVVTLGQLLKSNRDSVRLGAARTVLEMTIKLRDHAELEQRLAAMEAAQGINR
jgi:hypothetical protein